jgi:hypothetical protein
MAALLGTRGATGRRIAGGIVPPARHPQTTTELGRVPSGRTPDRINCKSTREFPQVQTNTERAAKYTTAVHVGFTRKVGLLDRGKVTERCWSGFKISQHSICTQAGNQPVGWGLGNETKLRLDLASARDPLHPAAAR